MARDKNNARTVIRFIVTYDINVIYRFEFELKSGQSMLVDKEEGIPKHKAA